MPNKQDWSAVFESLETFATHPEGSVFLQQTAAKIEQDLVADPRFLPTKEAILKHLQNDKNIPFFQEHRARMYHFYQSETYPKGVYRVCSNASYRSGNPDWQILFSVEQFDEILGDDVYLDGVSHNVLEPTRVLLTLSSNGQDAAYTLEFDLSVGSLVEGGFHFPLGKNHITWRDENSVWVSPAWNEAQLTESGYPREVWLMQRGQSFEEATPVLQAETSSMMVHAWRYLDGKGSPIDLIEDAKSFFQKQYYVVQNETPIALHIPESAEIAGYLAGQILLRLTDNWQRGKALFVSGSLLAIALNKGELGAATLIFEPNSKQALESVETTKNFLVIHILDQVKSCLKAWHFENGKWHAVDLPNLPSGTIELVDQPWGGDMLYIAISDFLMPLTLFALDLAHNELSVLRRSPVAFDAENYQCLQFEALSCDGTKIPYFWVGNQNGSNPETPTLVYAYGGFGMSELPHYLGSLGKHWLEKGASFVLANVRGGGEFGPAWHHVAQGKNKHKSVDDLLAVIHDLIDTGKSSASKIALQGGSNGGLLVASAFVREPTQIGAVVCEVPLTDMLQYPYWSAGSSWLEEYGDPEKSDDHVALAKLSPFHQLKAKIQYPPILLTTSLSDDRVHPIHALKFAAKLADLKQDFWLYQSDSGGHEGNQTQDATAKELALVWVFLYQKLGM